MGILERNVWETKGLLWELEGYYVEFSLGVIGGVWE